MAVSTTQIAQMRAQSLGYTGIASNIGEAIIIRRGTSTLASQNARVSKPSSAQNSSVDGGREMRQSVLLTGGVALDVAVGDRFNDQHGTLYEVVFVRPNRQIDTVAECKAAQ